MASVLQHIKAIKTSAYEPFIIRKAEKLRDIELSAFVGWVKEVLKVSITTNWLGNFLALVTVGTFTVVSLYSPGSGSAVTTAKIFTVISTIDLISEPLLMLGQQWGSMVTAWASFKRIETFLLCEEKAISKSKPTEDSPTAENIADSGGSVVPRVTPHLELKNASYGVREKVTLLEDISIDLVVPALWMIMGRVGSVSDYYRTVLMSRAKAVFFNLC